MSDTGLDGPLGGVAYDDAAIDHPADEQRGGAVKASVVIGALLVGLLVVGAVGARMMLADIPDRTVADAPDEVVCWDGETRLETECGAPSGRAGLRWMFPSFRPSDLGCRNVTQERPRSTRPTIFECSAHSSVGPVTITYSELTSIEQARQYLDKEYDTEAEELDDRLGSRLLWTEGGEPRDGTYKLEVIYADLPFSVEVRAGSDRARDHALESLVRFRPMTEAHVRPLD